MSKNTIQTSAAQKQDEQERIFIEEIAKACPLVEVKAEHGLRGWRLRGLLRGETFLDIRGHHASQARSKFHDAYSRAVQNGLLR